VNGVQPLLLHRFLLFSDPLYQRLSFFRFILIQLFPRESIIEISRRQVCLRSVVTLPLPLVGHKFISVIGQKFLQLNYVFLLAVI
jgi:hypothetical protein